MAILKKSLIWFCLIQLSFIFLMSHNAFAVDTIINLDNYETVRSAGFPKINCKFTNGAYDATDVASCSASPASGQDTVSLQRLYTTDSYSFEPGDIIEYDLLVYSTSQSLFAPDGFVSALGATQDYPFRVMSYKQTADNVFYDQRIGACSGNANASCTIFSSNVYYSVFHYTLLYVGPSNGSYPLGRNSGYSVMYNWSGNLEFKLANFVQYRSSGETKENKEQKEAAEDAAADSQTSGSSSQNDATNATSSLISVITSGIGAITSASASNCVINADMGNFDMGSIDLCANPVPTFMQVIGSIIAALVVLPLVIVLFNRFIAIIGSFQR